MPIENRSALVQTILAEELVHLQSRLQAREDDIRIAIAEAILSGEDSKAEALFAPVRDLGVLRRTICANATATLQPSQSPPLVSEATQSTWKRSGLGVTLQGRRIQGWNDACTFANVIQEIGCEQVAALGLIMNYLPMVAIETRRLAHQRYPMQMEKRNGWSIVTHCSTNRKRELLQQIKYRLGLDLTAEIVFLSASPNR